MQYIYGFHAVDSLLRKAPKSVQRLWVQEGRDDKRISALLELAQNQGVPIAREPKRDLDAMVSGRHQGVVAETLDEPVHGEVQQANLWQEADLLRMVEAKQEPVLILVLDGVTDPHNLGACMRSADAAGVDAVVVPKDKSADLTPTARKVACGAGEVVPFVRVTNIARTLEALQERGVWVYGAAGEAEKLIYDNDLKGSMALVMGAEGAGLRRLTREHCDFLIKLPMAGSVSSLNVSVATGICLFEVVRQRTQGADL
ncbi:23S rRNA (guanosine(2251)-2'-O)-methyltransferase RlmB [Halioglobus japonicus]|uniref:23S rRNA (guanosine-2'-O-)-methyltransferase RlmB n=1 Tax=Halioglobus japonicus TaxID=930805 RepID=A0AAP8MBK4_9GAMM|nr:23S rRNA (guanosine(2251)-2'-O)-methyltransferase RlmB [Halioglobus japonicus]AQA16872.1 23S rRNA (guanosine(2251)-2'-O)-methyltransferase RlmB [Halioglobus japonicus]PLW84755.1 23S rRNA (guanosine(2251)-2'-O)-methyltransferase RlmB [Halioglobus japonicus]GHD21249.1 23S rRNA (guanosine-2'-O-)-methyltransferase RlmB [Halioglobus japonicus]